MNLKFTAYFSVFTGLAVIGLWVAIFSGSELPEGKTELGFHIASELLMAFISIFSGVALIKQLHHSRRLNIAGLGMLMYSVLNAAGYYGQKEEFLIMAMFIALFLLTVVAFIPHLKYKH